MRNPLDIDVQGGFRILQSGGRGMRKDFPRRIPDSQDPPDTGARGCRGTFLGGSQTVRILRTLVPGGAEGLCQEDPRQSDTYSARGCRRTFPGGSQTVRILRTLVPGGAEGLHQEDPRQSGSSGHWCKGAQATFPGGSRTVRILQT